MASSEDAASQELLRFVDSQGGEVKTTELSKLYSEQPLLREQLGKGKLKKLLEHHATLQYDPPGAGSCQPAVIRRRPMSPNGSTHSGSTSSTMSLSEPGPPSSSTNGEPTVGSRVRPSGEQCAPDTSIGETPSALRSADRDLVSMVMAAPTIRILTVGSGDASQQVNYARTTTNMVVTFYDESRELVEKKYGEDGRDNLRLLDRSGVRLQFGVDATRLEDYPELGKFDVALFFFPHTGVSNVKPDSAGSNRALIKGFLDTVGSVLNPDGEVHLAVMTSGPYKKWGVDELLNNSGFAVTNKFAVDRDQLPTYVHRSTLGNTGSKVHKRPVDDTDSCVYTLEPKRNLDDTSTFRALCNRSIKFRAHVTHTTTIIQDDAILDPVHEILASANKPLDKLEILRHLNESLDLVQPVDTKQLNGVLTSLVARGILNKKESADPARPRPLYSVLDDFTGERTQNGPADVLGAVTAGREREQALERRRQQVFEVLRSREQDGGEPMGVLEIAHSIGFENKRDVNAVLFTLRDRGLVDQVTSSDGKPRWRAGAFELCD
mmetsp:Transcript_74986/g.160577  ORF Transcript_74986/g.160577 Transcript_74986/m.160577 type:complete len:549 (+) Transcript_74986:49-1695(+)